MRFFIDENFPPLVADALVAVYGLEHAFFSAYEDRGRYASVLDIPLMPLVREAGFDAIVTFDRQQMAKPDERKAVFDAGLHWVGLKMIALDGPDGIAWLSSSMLAVLPHLIDHNPDAPQVYRVKGALRQATQVMTTTPVWNAQLERTYGGR